MINGIIGTLCPNGKHRVTGWKRIAAVVSLSVPTVKRYKRLFGDKMPVHQIKAFRGRPVAYTEDLISWYEKL